MEKCDLKLLPSELNKFILRKELADALCQLHSICAYDYSCVQKQSKWIKKFVSRNKMWILNKIKCVIPLSKASLNYIMKYQLNLQKVIKN